MTQELIHRYPSVAHLAERAKKRIPHFSWEYLDSGTTLDEGMDRNRAGLAEVLMVPELVQGVIEPNISRELFGVEYAAPFGIGPVGLTGLMWPNAEKILARTAAKYRIPYGLSTVATQGPEEIGRLANGMGWFQLYPPTKEAVRRDLLKRAQDSGFTTLLVTVDVPLNSRRERQRRAGVSVPPKITPKMIYQSAIRPSWALETLTAGQPRFRGLERYAESTSMQDLASFIHTQFNCQVDWEYMKAVRDEWDGPVVVKGIMSAKDAKKAVKIGLDGVLVSNHGARQFDGAPAAIDVLPEIVEAVGKKTKILFDSGVRTGLDVARAVALGADFVLLGRAFIYGVAALGDRGGDLVAEILEADLKCNMVQIGCERLDQLKDRLR